MTNYEKIIRMSPEKMSCILQCPKPGAMCTSDEGSDGSCEACCLRWLNEECTDTAEDKLVAAKARLIGAVVDFMNDMDRLVASTEQCES